VEVCAIVAEVTLPLVIGGVIVAVVLEEAARWFLEHRRKRASDAVDAAPNQAEKRPDR
jgi:hypothetical protein